jgi:sarcosine oxidase, subunit gamma
LTDVDLRRSPLQGLAAGRGWPELFLSPGVSLREVPFVSQVNLRPDPDSDLAARAADALRLTVPVVPNTTATSGLRTALWLGPDEWLIVGPDGDAPGVATALRDALGADWGSVVDVSANRTVLELRGPWARSALTKGCPLDLHPRQFASGACAQSLLAKAQVILWQRDDQPTYWIFVRASFAVYVAEWLLTALQEFEA